MIFSRMIKLTHTCVCCKHNISKFGSFHFCGVKSGSFGKMCCFCNRLVDWGFCVGGLSTALGGKTSTKTRPSWIWKSTPLEDKGPTWGCHSRHQCIDRVSIQISIYCRGWAETKPKVWFRSRNFGFWIKLSVSVDFGFCKTARFWRQTVKTAKKKAERLFFSAFILESESKILNSDFWIKGKILFSLSKINASFCFLRQNLSAFVETETYRNRKFDPETEISASGSTFGFVSAQPLPKMATGSVMYWSLFLSQVCFCHVLFYTCCKS